METSQPQQPYGEVFDRGYQHYDGERLGRSYAVRALIIYSMKRGLGIKKRWTAKIMPFILYFLAFIPAFILVGIAAFIPFDEVETPTYTALYDSIELIVLIYAALLAPEMLAGDRRENVLQLYFSRPITRLDYLIAKISAMGILLLTIILLPPLILYFGLALTDADTLGYFRDNIGALFRIIGYGVLVSALWAALGLIVSTFTNRKGIAAAILIAGSLLLAAISEAFYTAFEEQQYSWSGYVIFMTPIQVIDALRASMFADVGPSPMAAAADLPGIVYATYIVIIVGISTWFLRRTYLRDE